MSNEAYLVASDTGGPAGVDGDDYIGYDPESAEEIAHAPYAVPIYWLALFKPSDLVTLNVAGENDEGEAVEIAVPSLLTDVSEARRRLADHQKALSDCFPEFDSTWQAFDGVLAGLSSQYIKVQMQELWDLEGDDFTSRVQAALRWFDTRNDDDFSQLLELASIERYDSAGRTFVRVGDDVPRAFHLRGYADDDALWDNAADT
jgi:hypothetical protein